MLKKTKKKLQLVKVQDHGYSRMPMFSGHELKDTHREKALSNKTPALTKSRHMGIWVVGTSNQLFIRGS